MIITGLTTQVRDPQRINVMVDGKYKFSLDITQVVDLGVRVGKEYDEAELELLEREGQFGKAYTRALEYALTRPRSQREIKDYLYRKTRTTQSRYRSGPREGQWYERPGITQDVATRVFDRLIEKGYVDDAVFTKFWIENHHIRKGSSQRQLTAELRAKGVDKEIIEQLLSELPRNDAEELQKIITKKASRYDDPQKLKAYLMRQGFQYEDINEALAANAEDADLT